MGAERCDWLERYRHLFRILILPTRHRRCHLFPALPSRRQYACRPLSPNSWLFLSFLRRYGTTWSVSCSSHNCRHSQEPPPPKAVILLTRSSKSSDPFTLSHSFTTVRVIEFPRTPPLTFCHLTKLVRLDFPTVRHPRPSHPARAFARLLRIPPYPASVT